MSDEGYRNFYRIVKTNPPSLWDMTSAKERGQSVPSNPALHAVWDGLSVYSTLSQARRKHRLSPVLGSFIAVLRIPTDGSVRYARTLGGDGHHTLWAAPAELSAFVVSIESA
jgi:hypothetical protein